MNDEETALVPKTFEELFIIYSNHKLDPLDIDNEVYEGILLTQIDFWLKKSDLFKVVFTSTDTGLAWMKFKKWRLDFDEFQDLLKNICISKKQKFEEIKVRMTEAGPPISETEPTITVK